MFAVSHLGKSEKTAIAFGAALLWQLSVTQYL
jgi:hypothetical protein